MKLQLVFWMMVVALAVCIVGQDYLDSCEGGDSLTDDEYIRRYFPTMMDAVAVSASPSGYDSTDDDIIDANLSATTDRGFIADSWTEVTALTITFPIEDGTYKDVSLDWRDGKLRLIGDPNNYDEAAKIFLTEGMYGAAYDLVAADPNAIRRLVREGLVWDAIQAEYGVNSNAVDH